VSKAQNGPFSMGYDPTDYFDFGNYNQNGTIETRFGSKTELVNLITKAHTENIHMQTLSLTSGGQLENNPYTGTQTYTNFTGVAPENFLEQVLTFIKIHTQTMTKVFLGFPDLAHVTPNVQNWLWLRTDGVGKY
jgi:alpha-amylase